MSSHRALVLRILTLLCGVVLIVAGAVTLGFFYQQPWASTVLEALHPEWWAKEIQSRQSPGFFAITAAALIIIGLLLWWVIFDRRGITNIRLTESSSAGTLPEPPSAGALPEPPTGEFTDIAVSDGVTGATAFSGRAERPLSSTLAKSSLSGEPAQGSSPGVIAHASASGKLTVRLDDIGSAMAQDIRRLPDVAGCSYKAETDRGHKVIELRIRCESSADLSHVTAACRLSAEHVELALPNEDVTTRYLIEVNRLTSQR